MPDRARLSPARLFLAVWPDPETRSWLAEAGRWVEAHWGGRPSRPETLHLTLVFIGPLERTRLDALRQALSNLRAPPFELTLDRLACWRHNRIAYLAPSEPPEALIELVTALERRLDGLSMDYDHRPYAPHVTLARKVPCPPSSTALDLGSNLLTWSVRSFDLVESVPTPTGVRYAGVARQGLAGPA